MAIIGIDLGTTNSLAATWKDNDCLLIPNAFGEFLTPSVVGIGENGEILTGKVAKERLISHPHLTAAAFKRFMGTKKKTAVGDRTFLPEELSSIILRKIKMDAESYLQTVVTEAIISVPAYFNDHQRNATKLAAELAGFHVERLINEPSAAALAGHFTRMDNDECCLVIDFGGGTLDVSVVDCFESVIEIAAVAGDNHLGGNDFDVCIIEWFCHECGLDWAALEPTQQAILCAQAEYCKQRLTETKEVQMHMHTKAGLMSAMLTRKTLVQICEPLLRRINNTIKRALADSKRTIATIDNVMLVGGSCKMPVVRNYLEFVLDRQALSLDEPDTIVAKGVGIYTGIKQRDQSLRDIMMTDVCPFTLGTSVISRKKAEKHIFFPIIERNSILPTSVERRLWTASHHQTEICVEIFQGEEYFSDDNLLLGSVSIPVPPAVAGKESVNVRYTYDINGILEVELCHIDTNTRRQLVIMGEGSKLSQEEIARKLLELEKLKIPPAEQEENQFVLAKGARLFTQTLGPTRERLEIYLTEFLDALSSQDQREISRVRKQTEKYLQDVENQLLVQNPMKDYAGFQEIFNGVEGNAE